MKYINHLLILSLLISLSSCDADDECYNDAPLVRITQEMYESPFIQASYKYKHLEYIEDDFFFLTSRLPKDYIGTQVIESNGKPYSRITYIKFNGMDQIPSGTKVDSAHLEYVYTDPFDLKQKLYEYGDKQEGAFLQRITEEWSITDSLAPGFTNENEVELPQITDYQVLDSLSPQFQDQSFKIDITRLTQDVLDNGNLGFRIASTSTTPFSACFFYSFLNGINANRAYLRVFYTKVE